MAETRQIAKPCRTCGKPLHVLVNGDGDPIIRGGDATAVCVNLKCIRNDDRIEVDPTETDR